MITGCPDDQNISFQNSLRDLLISNRASARIRTRVDDRSPQRQGSCSNIRCHHIEKKQKMFLMYIRRSENTRDCWDIISLINGGEWNEVWLSGYKADHLCTVHDQRMSKPKNWYNLLAFASSNAFMNGQTLLVKNKTRHPRMYLGRESRIYFEKVFSVCVVWKNLLFLRSPHSY